MRINSSYLISVFVSSKYDICFVRQPTTCATFSPCNKMVVVNTLLRNVLGKTCLIAGTRTNYKRHKWQFKNFKPLKYLKIKMLTAVFS